MAKSSRTIRARTQNRLLIKVWIISVPCNRFDGRAERTLRNFSKTKRMVIKLGTHVLSKGQEVDTDFLRDISSQIAQLTRQKRQVILVTSGAVGMGAGALGIAYKISDVKKRQACAAVGQVILMHEYRRAFDACGQKVAQVLLTNAIMSNRRYYVNLKNTVETLLSMGVVPIVNENDCVSIEEIGLAFGDNDKLSALVASKIDAELLIMLTDVDGLYDRNPRKSKQAKLIPVVYEITDEIHKTASKTGSTFSTGGMTSKIAAIEIAAQAGCRAVLANGRTKNVLMRIVAGEEIGTLFLPKRRLSNRKRWILNCRSEAHIEIDPGAAEAISKSRSLLAVGITGLDGNFQSGEVVEIVSVSQSENVGTGKRRVIAKGIAGLSSGALSELLERQSQGLEKSRGKRRAIIHADDMVLVESSR